MGIKRIATPKQRELLKKKKEKDAKLAKLIQVLIAKGIISEDDLK